MRAGLGAGSTRGGGVRVAGVRAAALGAALLLCAGCGLARATLPGRRVQLQPGAWALLDGGGNSLLVRTRAGLLLVDPKWGLGVDEVKAAAHDAHGEVRWIVATHGHPDHVAGREAFTRARLFAADTAQLPEGMRKDFPVERERVVLLGGERVVLLRFAAHTSGDLAVWLPDRGLLATGDLVMTGYVGHVDGGSWLAWLSALDVLAQLPARVVVPGHGDLAGPEELLRQRDLLHAARDGLRAGIPRVQLLAQLRSRFELADFPLVSSLDALLDGMGRELGPHASALSL